MSCGHLYLDYQHGDGGDRISLHTYYTDTTQTSLHNVHHTTLPVKVSVTLRLRVTQSSIRATSPSIDCSLPDKKIFDNIHTGSRKDPHLSRAALWIPPATTQVIFWRFTTCKVKNYLAIVFVFVFVDNYPHLNVDDHDNHLDFCNRLPQWVGVGSPGLRAPAFLYSHLHTLAPSSRRWNIWWTNWCSGSSVMLSDAVVRPTVPSTRRRSVWRWCWPNNFLERHIVWYR